MCGRYTITVTMEELMLYYHIEESSSPWHQPRYNVAPGQSIPAIVHDGKRNRLGELKWGLVPAWADDPKIGYTMINARAETAASRPAFREPFRRKRCIVPADGFYEWMVTGRDKQPIRFVLKSRSLFSMAALYDTWRAPDGTKLSTCTILTTDPNDKVSPVHNRMPVILRPEDEAVWLNRDLGDPSRLQALLKPYPSEEMEAYPVGAAVGNVRNDDASLIEPLPPARP